MPRIKIANLFLLYQAGGGVMIDTTLFLLVFDYKYLVGILLYKQTNYCN
jgi:hypothetical protein